jgi:hypothetical protein
MVHPDDPSPSNRSRFCHGWLLRNASPTFRVGPRGPLPPEAERESTENVWRALIPVRVLAAAVTACDPPDPDTTPEPTPEAAHDGPCNEFWREGFPAGGGPAATGAGLSDTWPPGGFEMQLDLHLDPAYGGPVGEFAGYVVAVNLLDQQPDDWEHLVDLELRYLFVPIVVEDGTVAVDGHGLEETGWHTFRHVFREGADGNLAVDFELIRDTEVVLARQLEEAVAFDEEGETQVHPVSSLLTQDFPRERRENPRRSLRCHDWHRSGSENWGLGRFPADLSSKFPICYGRIPGRAEGRAGTGVKRRAEAP